MFIMKNIFFTLALLVCGVIIVFAQAPQAFKYQAVARNSTGEILMEQIISFRIGILEGSAGGTQVYSEIHNDTTNQFGLVSLEIGNGTVVSGVFEEIDWGSNSFFLQVEMDENGGTNYQFIGTSQLLSVPYANYSATTGDTSMWRKQSENVYYNKGNVGIGTESPSEKLQVDGSLKFVDGNEGLNKVLTSDDSGKASWENLSDVNRGFTNPQYPDGTDGITPITEIVNSTTSYTVPTGKNLYILNVLSINDNNSLEINDKPITYGYYNNGSISFSQRLSNPLVATQGDVIDGSDATDITINGYLVGLSSGSGGTPPFVNCGDILTDIDGNTYNTVEIGAQCWIKENLKVGTMINGSQDMSDNGIIEKYCYDNDSANCSTYGGLYQWDEAMQYVTTAGTQGICPDGWHLPTDEEWKQLEGEVDSQYGYPDPEWDGSGWRGYDAGLNLKATSGWNYGGNGTDLYGFGALPGGLRYADGSFYSLGDHGGWWSSSEGSGSDAWSRSLYYDRDGSGRYDGNKSSGRSVRCLQD